MSILVLSTFRVHSVGGNVYVVIWCTLIKDKHHLKRRGKEMILHNNIILAMLRHTRFKDFCHEKTTNNSSEIQFIPVLRCWMKSEYLCENILTYFSLLAFFILLLLFNHIWNHYSPVPSQCTNSLRTVFSRYKQHRQYSLPENELYKWKRKSKPNRLGTRDSRLNLLNTYDTTLHFQSILKIKSSYV